MRLGAPLLSLLLLSCAGDVGGTGLAINDPLGLIDDVEGPLRLFVLPAAGFSCEATTGAVSPEVPDVGQGMFDEAVADVSVAVMSSMASTEVQVPGGEYTVLVRGKGTDPVTGITDTFIATGCTPVTIGAGETLEIRVTLLPIVGMGVCGDGTFSPDEQCEDGNTEDGDGCSATCRTEALSVSTSSGADGASLGGAPDQRWVSTFDVDRERVHIRLLEADASAITSPSVLGMDAPLSDAVTTPISGLYLLGDVAVASDGRIGVGFTSFSGGSNVRAAFFDRNRTAMGGVATLQDDAGAGARSSVAFAGDGAFLTVFEDATSASGLSGAVFDAGASTAGSLFEVGASGGGEPSVAGAGDHFVVAFTAGEDVFVQRFGSDGAPRDAEPVAVLDDPAGVQDQPAVAALADGRALVVWREGEGSAIRARAFGADGAPAGEAFAVDTTDAGELGAPSAAGGGDGFVVAFESGGSVRARLISGAGDPLPNREQPPTTADFEVAASGSQPDVAVGGDARWMVAWTEGDAIRGRLFALP